jgi:hypothetical protein
VIFSHVVPELRTSAFEDFRGALAVAAGLPPYDLMFLVADFCRGMNKCARGNEIFWWKE